MFEPGNQEYDVCVVGGGPGGVPAAVAAARAGRSVLLVERAGFLGGVAVSGLPLLGFLDHTGAQVVGGIAQELIDAISIHHATSGHRPCAVHNSVTAVTGPWLRLEMLRICREAGVHLFLHAELTGVDVADGAVRGIRIMSCGKQYQFQCKILIDATGDGEAACMAGASYEKSSSLQPASLMFNVGNVDIEAVRDYIDAHPETVSLPATFNTEEFNYQTFRESLGFVFIGYSEFMQKARDNGEIKLLDKPFMAFIPTMNPGEVCINMTRAICVDGTQALSLTQAEIICQEQIPELMNVLRKYCPGFENCYLASIAPGIGVRETRRIDGIKCLTREALKTLAVGDDTIALAGYIVDIHASENMETYYEQISHAVGIPYGCIVSKDVKGLLMSGRCICVDSYVFGMTRAMATCMAIGQAAGEAAAMAAEQAVSPAEIRVDLLQSRLLTAGMVLSVGEANGSRKAR